MTISSATTKDRYLSNGLESAFPYTFKILDDEDIKVVLTTPAGIESVQVLDTNYTVDGVGEDNGGTVSFITSAANPYLVPVNYIITLYRELDLTQETDYIENDAFGADVHEEALDRLTMMVQQLNELNARTLKAPVSDASTVNLELPAAADRASKVLIFDAEGDVDAYDLTELEVNDHGGLAGLADDDHTHYYNQARGDARYEQITAHNTDISDLRGRLNALETSAGTYELITDHNIDISDLRGRLNSHITTAGHYDIVGGQNIVVTYDDGTKSIEISTSAPPSDLYETIVDHNADIDDVRGRLNSLEASAAAIPDTIAEWTAQQNFDASTLSSTSNAVAWNLNSAQVAKLAMTEATTISAPSNMKDGAFYSLLVSGHAASSYTLAWNAAFTFGAAGEPDDPPVAGKVLFTFYCDGTNMYGMESWRSA